MSQSFDATIGLLASHLAIAGIAEARAEEALEAVRQAVRAMPGARHIDCEYVGRLPARMRLVASRWITLYESGSIQPQEGPEWTALKLDIAEAMHSALKKI